MLWKFSFASGSTLDTLLSRETPPSVEELLDEQDILAECKAQNNKWVQQRWRLEGSGGGSDGASRDSPLKGGSSIYLYCCRLAPPTPT